MKVLRSRLRVGTALAVAVAAIACGKDAVQPDPGDRGFPGTLSDLLAGAGLFPYEPQYPLWTNGALKLRAVRAPGVGAVDISDPGAWDFAEGTMFVKTFAYQTPSGPRNIETRIIQVMDGNYETAVYLWNDAQTDASLVEDDIRIPVGVTDNQGNSFNHVVPSRTDCQSCHGSAPSFILGFNELQLNAPITGGTLTQLEEFQNAGWFSSSLPATPAEIVGDADTKAVIGYFQANCVHCHNPNGPFDLGYQTFFAKTVNVSGPSGGKLLVPQDPAASGLYARLVAGSMPPLGVQFPDAAGQAMIENWILNHDFSQQPAAHLNTHVAAH